MSAIAAAWAAFKLQRDRDAREDLALDLVPRAEFVGDHMGRPGTSYRFSRRTILWVTLRTTGRGGTFSARFSDVHDVERGGNGEPLSDYWGYVAWEDTEAERREIGFKAQAKLQVAFTFRDPPVFWFVGPTNATWAPEGHSSGWALVAPSGEFTFLLQIVNETYEYTVEKIGRVVFDDKTGAVALFELLDPEV